MKQYENALINHPITTQALRSFTGSVRFFRHSLSRNVIFTEGCAFLAANGAAWLIDEIALVQNIKSLKDEEFQSWRLMVNRETNSAVLLATDGGAAEDENGAVIYKELYQKEIPFTDFPLETVSLYCCRSGESQKTIMLTSEY